MKTASSGTESPRTPTPSSKPSSAKDTPTATPSGKLWTVRIPKMSTSFFGSPSAMASMSIG